MDNIKTALVYLAIGLVFVIGGAWVSSIINQTATPTPPSTLQRSVVECPNDSQSFAETQSSTDVVLLNDVQSYAKAGDGFPIAYNVVLKRTALQSQIACGYLHFVVDIGGKPLHSWEGFYMVPTNSEQFGGHLNLDPNAVIANTEVNGKTDVIYPLNDIEYKAPDGSTGVADWASLLNVSADIGFTIALNTTNPAGHIDLVEIAYKCWNPQTGAQTNDCGLATSSIQQISN
ncbi:MAG TPA: hypothetical protein VMT81_02895 [Candidatus Paceibacterota bacterium]|nr:hypothetical protein [Candidatus Paceibacterota bacterium]